ncbi:hypothetical protein H5410_041546, partial [Solanum commersonii]
VAIAWDGNNPKGKFAGAEMTTSLWNPLVSNKQHSACRLKIQKGHDIVQVGWRAGNQQCFNTLCPSFVVVNTEIPVDTTFSGMSHRGDEASWEETMAITKVNSMFLF